MFGPNHILVTLRWDDRRSQIITGSIQTITGSNCVFLGKCLTWNLNFQNRSKALCLGASEPAKRLAAQSTAYILHNQQGKQAFVKENDKKKKSHTCDEGGGTPQNFFLAFINVVEKQLFKKTVEVGH